MKSSRIIVAVMLLTGGGLRAQLPADAAAAMAQAMAALGGMANQEAVAASGTIDAKEMRALLPEKEAFPGYKRTKAATESNAMLGVKLSVARAEFAANDGNAGFEIKYLDIAGLSGFAKMALAIHEIDEESENGFKRTLTYPGGFKALEEFDGEQKRTEIKTFVGEQIVVEFNAHGVAFEEARKFFDAIDLKKLAALKPTVAVAE